MLRTIFFAACVAVMTTTNAIHLEDVDDGLQQYAQSGLDQPGGSKGNRGKALKVLGTNEKGVANAKANKILGVT